ncbi:translesion DNA synthesis-associated protein ImuA [Comamonas sp. J-3]|jgi:protein ImuA|uniref:translesion DNA synthesis-associated protein ImuA n=1 Tax=Comamonas trifloxystrobinivorans TaxID=3350256 RepID=UPI0037278FC4
MLQRSQKPLALPPTVANAVWRGDHLLRTQRVCAPSGWAALDAELPGHGWPSHSLIEVLQAQAGQLEWRLAAAALQQQSAQRQAIVALGAPLPPHASGLAQQGIAPEQLVWVQGGSPQDQLWALEQLLRANAAGALLAWLPQALPEQIRRLQISAQQFAGLVFLFRPQHCQQQASAAPLRLLARASSPWALQVQVFKRRGPVHTGWLDLPAVPHCLQTALTPRMQPEAPHSTPHTSPLPAKQHDTALGRLVAPRTALQH